MCLVEPNSRVPDKTLTLRAPQSHPAILLSQSPRWPGPADDEMPDFNTRPRILLVEDYDDAREMYRDYLEFSGFQVDTARDGHEALEQARRHSPDLVLMDLSLPGLDGWEATRILKSDPATSHLIVVALSAHALGRRRSCARGRVRRLHREAMSAARSRRTDYGAPQAAVGGQPARPARPRPAPLNCFSLSLL